MTAVRRRAIQDSGFRGLLGTALARFLLLVALFEEIDADLIAVDPGELAAAVRKTRGRQQQEEFLEVQTLDRALHRELGAGLGDVFHHTIGSPGTVDTHHVRREPAFECDAVTLAPFRSRHGCISCFQESRLPRTEYSLLQIKGRLANKW